jgi:MinD-like ATPase involved in chromosome partitioning or flagellar assembly
LYVITFYSFKGGVGRTMALVNTAAELAQRGRKVLLVDFDLEAPGLSTYNLLRPAKPHPGIVEYVTKFRETRHGQVPLVTDFIYQAKTVGKDGGPLWVMPAGRGDAEYRRMLNALNWQTLYEKDEGFLLFEDTRSQWEAELHPDYVLIDARTGHTDIEGICTRQLPDAVVLIFYPNEQNLVGLIEVCRHIREEKSRKKIRGRKEPVELHFVASNVPDLDDEDQYLSRHLSQFREKLAIRDETIPTIHRNETLQMLDQPVFVLDRPRARLAKEYCDLANVLIRGNRKDPDGVLARLKDYCDLYSPGDHYESGHVFFEQIMIHRDLDQFAADFWDNSAILSKLAECRMLEGSFGSASELLDRVLTLEPSHSAAFFQRSSCKNRLGDKAGAAEDLCRFLQGPNLQEHDVLRALRELALIPEEKFVDALKFSSIEGLSRNGKIQVTEIIAGTRNGLDSAIEFFHRVNFPLEDWSYPQSHWELACLVDSLSSHLIVAKRFAEAVELIEKAVHSFDDLHDRLLLSMNQILSSWADSDNLPESLAKQWLKFSDDPPEQGLWPYENPLTNQINALALWRLGRVPEALNEVDRAIKWMKQRGHEEFSCWRFGVASPSHFLDDCAKLRRMIQGEPLRPAFLGSAPLGSSPGGKE